MIYEFLLTLPKGKVITYKALAKKFNMHHRAIAKILSMNPEPNTYPCYKVVYSSGEIGGYVLGRDEKIRRLIAEGIVIENKKVKDDYIIYKL